MALTIGCFAAAGAIWLSVLVATIRGRAERVIIRRTTIVLIGVVPLVALAGWWWAVH